MSKLKVSIKKSTVTAMMKAGRKERINETDGLKIDFEAGWVHLRLANTEPIVRIYCEAGDPETALMLINKVKSVI